MSPPTRLVRLLLQSTLIGVAVSRQCYFTDGSIGQSELQPCFPDQEDSLCCGINKSNGDPDDICLSNGMCLAQVAPYTGLVLLNGCTQSSWGTSDCPNPCPSSQKGSFGIHVLPCNSISNEHWCCSASGEDCCDDAFKIEMGTVMLNASSSTSRSPTSSSTSTSTTTSTTGSPTSTSDFEPTTPVASPAAPTADSAAADNTEDCPVKQTTIVGVGVGVGVGLGVCLATSLVALYLQRRMYQRKLHEQQSVPPMAVVGAPINGYYGPPPLGPPAELPLNKPPSLFEMGSGRDSTRYPQNPMI